MIETTNLSLLKIQQNTIHEVRTNCFIRSELVCTFFNYDWKYIHHLFFISASLRLTEQCHQTLYERKKAIQHALALTISSAFIYFYLL